MAIKFFVFAAVVAIAHAGIPLAAPAVAHYGPALHRPLAYAAAPAIHRPLAYAAAPAIHRPLAYAAPAYGYAAHAAPLAYGAAPIAKAVVAAPAEFDAHPQYNYAYSVQDAITGDNKHQEETRDGDVVKGSYSLVEADGTRRIVEYTADDVNGFNAVVHKEGVAVQKAVVAAPAYAKVAAPLAYAAAPVHYGAPVAKIAAPLHYASTIAKVATPLAYHG